MSYVEPRRFALIPTLPVVAALLLSNPGLTDILHFRVAFEDVPGAAQIEAGDLKEGIKTLENQSNRSDQRNRGAILATLCAAYIINNALDKAESPCNKAVESDPTAAAYNNRGVFRAATGDYSGARVDFDRVRPRQLEAYLEDLKKSHPPLIAADNFRLIHALMTKHSAAAQTPVFAINTVTIEDLSH